MTSDDFLPAATGVGTHLQSIASLLAERGHAVMVITTRRVGQPTTEVWNGVQVLRVTTVKMFGFYQALPSRRTLLAAFEEFKPDLVHHHYLGLMLVQALHVARALRIPQVYTYHMTEDHLTQPLPMRPLKGLIRRGIHYCCARMDQIVSVSENLARALALRNFGTPISYISNPVSFQEQPPASPAVQHTTFQVLFAGRLNPEKNIPLLLRAFAVLLRSRPDAQLVIAGHGSQRPALVRLATKLNLSSRVTFTGFLPSQELALRYAACDVFVLPSWVETQGLVAMEAMHFSKAILVARSIVSADELVENGQNGYLVDPTDETELAERLVQLADDPALRQRLGQAGHLRAQRFRPSLVAAQLEALYQDTLQR